MASAPGQAQNTSGGIVRSSGNPRFSGEIAPEWFLKLLDHPSAKKRLAFLLGVLMVVFSAPPLYNNFYFLLNKDYDLWYWTGWFFRDGALVYPRLPRQLFPFMYPPSCAFMLALATLAGAHGYMIILLALNSLAWLGSIFCSIDLVGSSSIQRKWILLALLPTAFVVPYIHDTYLLGQPSLLMLALMLGGFSLLKRKKDGLAGFAFGIAAAIKAYPIMAIVYLLYRRRWKAAAAMGLLVGVLLFAAPLMFRTKAQVKEDFLLWTKGMVLKYDSKTIAQRPERCYSFKNQSLVALESRLFREVPADGEVDPFWRVNVMNLTFKQCNMVIALTGLAFCLIYVAVMPPKRRMDERDMAHEASMLLIMILMFAPLSFNYSYIWLLFPFAMGLKLALDADSSGERRAHTAAIGLAVGLLTLSIAVPKTSQAYGNVLLSGVVLFAISAKALAKKKWKGSRMERLSAEGVPPVHKPMRLFGSQSTSTGNAVRESV